MQFEFDDLQCIVLLNGCSEPALNSRLPIVQLLEFGHIDIRELAAFVPILAVGFDTSTYIFESLRCYADPFPSSSRVSFSARQRSMHSPYVHTFNYVVRLKRSSFQAKSMSSFRRAP